MGKDDMIRHILRSFESDCYSASAAELTQELENESLRLSEKDYCEVEELYYRNVPSAWTD